MKREVRIKLLVKNVTENGSLDWLKGRIEECKADAVVNEELANDPKLPNLRDAFLRAEALYLAEVAIYSEALNRIESEVAA